MERVDHEAERADAQAGIPQEEAAGFDGIGSDTVADNEKADTPDPSSEDSSWYDTPEPVEQEPYETIPWFPDPVIVPEGEWVDLWRHGGENALVTVFPAGFEPHPRHAIGICTIARYLHGLTPYEIEIGMRIPGLLRGARGIDVHRVTRLPRVDDILTLFTGHLPGSADDRPPDGRPRMPKRLHFPRWQICNLRREFLEYIGGTFHGKPLELRYDKLPAINFSSGRPFVATSAVQP